jgi:hypothetical protein
MQFHPDQERSGDQLKKKFNKLAKTQMGTGDPTMPADVREAKVIRGLIIEKSEGVTGSEEEPFALGEDDQEEGEQGNVAEEEEVAEEPAEEYAVVGRADWRGAVGVAHANGSVRGGRGGGVARAGSSASSASPNQGVSFVSFTIYVIFIYWLSNIFVSVRFV